MFVFEFLLQVLLFKDCDVWDFYSRICSSRFCWKMSLQQSSWQDIIQTCKQNKMSVLDQSVYILHFSYHYNFLNPIPSVSMVGDDESLDILQQSWTTKLDVLGGYYFLSF